MSNPQTPLAPPLLMMTRPPAAATVALCATESGTGRMGTMRANLVGFELHVGRTVSLSEFFDHLRTLKGQQMNFGGHDRMIDIGERDDYYVGLFITIKDQAKFCELRNEDGEIKISVRSLDERTNIVDFNFFLVHKETGRGLYLHYHQSCSANQFGMFCRRRYEDLRDAKKGAEIAALGPLPPKKALKAIAQHYKKVTLKLVVMVRRENLSSLLEEFDRIQVFEFDIQSLSAQEADYAPIRQFIKRETHRIRFQAQSSQSAVRNWINKMAGADNIQRGRVQGLDEDGQTHAYRLMDNPDSFGSFEYEEIADDSILSFHDFESSPLLDSMFKVVSEYQHIFEVPAE